MNTTTHNIQMQQLISEMNMVFLRVEQKYPEGVDTISAVRDAFNKKMNSDFNTINAEKTSAKLAEMEAALEAHFSS